MEIRVVKEDEQFAALKDQWNAIHSKMIDATPFQTWEWSYHWWNNHKEEAELHLLVAFEGKGVFGIAPLVIKDKSVCFIGDVHFDYGMFVCAERKQEIAQLFFSEIEQTAKEKKATISLRNIPVKSDQYALFKAFSQKKKCCVWRELVDTANVNLSEYCGFDGYLKAISASLRKKAIKPCVNAGMEYAIEPYTDELWSDIEEIYQNRMEDRVGHSTLDWAQNVVKALNAAGILQISTVKHNGQRVAFLIFFESKGTDYVWLTAFKKVEKYQLGHYVRYLLIDRAYEQNIHKVDMMRGAYGYKKQWDCNVSTNWELVTFRSALKRNIYLVWNKFRPKIKQLVLKNSILKKIYERKGK